MVTYVTQNFQVLDSSNKTKPPIYKRKNKIFKEDLVPNSLSNRLNNLETPIVKYSAKPSMLLPRSSINIEQSPLDYFQAYNDSVYELLIKSKRRALIAKYNATQAVNSLKSDSFVHGSVLSDKLCSPYEDERLSSFINNLTNRRRKTSLAANRAKTAFEMRTYENITSQKPLCSTNPSRAVSPSSQMNIPDSYNSYVDEENKKSKNTPYQRSQTAMDSKRDLNQFMDTEKRPKTATNFYGKGEIDSHKSIEILAKFIKTQKRESISNEQNEKLGVEGIKLFTERFLHLIKPKTSTPNINVENMIKIDENASNDSNNKTVLNTPVNHKTLNEIDDEEIKEIQSNLNKKQNNFNILSKPPSTPVGYSFNSNNQNVKAPENEKILVKSTFSGINKLNFTITSSTKDNILCP